MTDTHSQVVLLENAYLRVTREHVPVGASIEVHTHDRPHLIVPVQGDRAQQLDADGAVLFEVDYGALEPGVCLFVGPDQLPLTHALRNTGDRPLLNLRIDVLAEPPADG